MKDLSFSSLDSRIFEWPHFFFFLLSLLLFLPLSTSSSLLISFPLLLLLSFPSWLIPQHGTKKDYSDSFSYFHDDWRLGLLAQNLETGSTFSHSHSLIYESLRKSRALPYFRSLFNKTKTTGKSSLSHKRGEMSKSCSSLQLLPEILAFVWLLGEKVFINKAEILILVFFSSG